MHCLVCVVWFGDDALVCHFFVEAREISFDAKAVIGEGAAQPPQSFPPAVLRGLNMGGFLGDHDEDAIQKPV